MKKLLLVLLLPVFLISGELKIAAAANTSYVLVELANVFMEKNPDVKITSSFDSSGSLVAQIKQGAPFDMFLAADVGYADKLYKDGLTTAKPDVYARGTVVILSVRGFDLKDNYKSILNPKIKSICIANPKTAPYGTASVAALKKAGIYDQISSKIVEAGSIGKALSQTIAAADVGFINASAMYAPENKAKYQEGKHYVYLDPTLYSPIDQAMVILKRTPNLKEAQAFYDFLLSEEGQAIFKKFGY